MIVIVDEDFVGFTKLLLRAVELQLGESTNVVQTKTPPLAYTKYQHKRFKYKSNHII